MLKRLSTWLRERYPGLFEGFVPVQAAPALHRDYPAETILVFIRPVRAWSDSAAATEWDRIADCIHALVGDACTVVAMWHDQSATYRDSAAALANRLPHSRMLTDQWNLDLATADLLLERVAEAGCQQPIVVVLSQPVITRLARQSGILYPLLEYLGMATARQDMPLEPIPLLLHYHHSTQAELKEGWE